MPIAPGAIRIRVRVCALALSVFAIATLTPAPGADARSGTRGDVVKVMTRNLFLGADLTPALEAATPGEFVQANGAILREVDMTNFPLRSVALADEIKRKRPDLVGLQEVALWRTGPASLDPVLSGVPTATDVTYDFLRTLLDRLNGKRKLYRVAVVKRQFDFEAPADKNGVPDDGPIAVEGLDDAELNGRLTMRDAILARRGVQFGRQAGGTFDNLLRVNVSGVDVTVHRGWTQLDAKVHGGRWFRFVNTHLEAFDDETETPSIRQLQAQEVGDPGGYAASGPRPVVLLGDLNSDDDTVAPNDQKAYRALLELGWVPRSTSDPLSCCVSDLFASPPSEFDHHIDHVMTDSPRRVQVLRSSVTGRARVSGIYPSDHAGVVSALLVR